MSVGGFARALVLTLLFSTYAAALGEHAGLSPRPSPSSLGGPARTEMSSQAPEEPSRLEKFILKSVGARASSRADATAAVAAKAQPESTLPDGSRAEPTPAASLNVPAPPLSLPARPSPVDKAYADAYAILSEDNPCSDFFGGPRLATVVLNAVRPRLETAVLTSNVGISMSGPVISATDAGTGLGYRLFKKAEVNLTGPFFRSTSNLTQTFFRSIGRYPANTRKARVLMLLHELGHLVPSEGGHWLLPDDGNDPAQVAVNTDTVMDRCGGQIDSLE
jgi:hypothetical protein